MTKLPVKRPLKGVRTPLAELTAALERQLVCRAPPGERVGDWKGLKARAKDVTAAYCHHLLVDIHWLAPR